MTLGWSLGYTLQDLVLTPIQGGACGRELCRPHEGFARGVAAFAIKQTINLHTAALQPRRHLFISDLCSVITPGGCASAAR